MVLLPSVNAYYAAIFYAIPLVSVFYEQQKSSLLDKLMVLCMALVLWPPHFLAGVYGVQQEQLFTFVGILGILLAVLLIISTGIDLVQNKKFRFWDLPEEQLSAENSNG